jgi:hypothetical protein
MVAERLAVTAAARAQTRSGHGRHRAGLPYALERDAFHLIAASNIFLLIVGFLKRTARNLLG